MNKLKPLWRATRCGHKAILVDGGLSTELTHQGARFDNDLWTASLVSKAPERLIKAHEHFLEAGAQIITTASYQASIQGYIADGYTTKEAEDIIGQSVEVALEARERSNHPDALIAASIGPYGAYLADGSEYRGDYKLSVDELILFHQSRWDILKNTRADLFAIETIPSITELKGLATLIKRTPEKECWVSLQCRNGKQLADGSDISHAVNLFEKLENVVAIGVNCVQPDDALAASKYIRSLTSRPLIVYPNRGNHYDCQSKTWDKSTSQIDMGVFEQLIELSPVLIGGCCEVSAADIAELNQRLFVSDVEDKADA